MEWVKGRGTPHLPHCRSGGVFVQTHSYLRARIFSHVLATAHICVSEKCLQTTENKHVARVLANSEGYRPGKLLARAIPSIQSPDMIRPVFLLLPVNQDSRADCRLVPCNVLIIGTLRRGPCLLSPGGCSCFRRKGTGHLADETSVG